MHKVFVVCFMAVLGFSCSGKTENKSHEAVRYPNQDAPLALLMREMFLDMEEIKISVEEGQSIKGYLEKYKELLTAKPTDQSVKTEAFQTMGMGYLANLRQFENSSDQELLENYKVLVNSCLACHSNYCPGPIKRINLLKLE
ncbi:hypothetical protein ACFSKL_03240 [Belliella marina]|uniref:Cytochrome C n=1 Tax=Belliella marina TaxID=1644146 RepID=A0ABW4VHG9_9BACT